MYRTIVVPISGAARSERALPVAISLARASGAALELVRVLEPHPGEPPRHPDRQRLLRSLVQADLDALADSTMEQLGLPVGCAVLDPPAAQAIRTLVAQRADPLIVMATHGRVGFTRTVLGSVSDELIRSGVAPVLALRDTERGRPPSWHRRNPFTNIVVPVDGSTQSERVVTHALAIGRVTGATIHLVRVLEPLMTTSLGVAMGARALPDFTDPVIFQRELATDYLDALTARIAAAAPELRVRAEVATSAQVPVAIVDACHRHRADLVVMATHGRGPSRLLIAAVADAVIEQGTDAILMVRPPRVTIPRWVLNTGEKARRTIRPASPMMVG